MSKPFGHLAIQHKRIIIYTTYPVQELAYRLVVCNSDIYVKTRHNISNAHVTNYVASLTAIQIGTVYMREIRTSSWPNPLQSVVSLDGSYEERKIINMCIGPQYLHIRLRDQKKNPYA